MPIARSVLTGRALTPSGSYSTTFPNTENPFTDGGRILQGGTDGLDWQNTRSTPGKLFGVAASAGFDDCTCCLKTLQGVNPLYHYSRVIISRTGGYTPPSTHEVSIVAGVSISGHVIDLYEFIFPFASTLQAVRWRGAVGGFVVNGDAGWPNVPTGAGFTDAQDNDVCEVRFDGRSGTPNLTVHVNGSQVLAVTDTTGSKITSGQPGASFFARAGTGLDMASYCIKSWEAGSL